MTRPTRWAILTGEFPPQPGGVSDYTRLIATGLAAAGDAVRVYAPPGGSSLPSDDVEVVRLKNHFGPRSLAALDRHLVGYAPDRILIQYVPQAFGWRGMNLPFAAWVAARARRIAPVWVMFHEVMTGLDWGRPLRHLLLSRTTWVMARFVAGAANRVFVSIPAWADTLRRVCPPARPAEWLPIPSTLPDAADPDRVAAVRHRVAPAPGAIVVGHFGTFGGMNRGLLAGPFAALLRDQPRRAALFIGRGSGAFRDAFAAEHPDLGGRVFASGDLPPADAAAHLAACDVLIQPYPDGASSRRTSLMSGLALGVPTVTNTGFLSEPIWGTESDGVAVTASAEASALVPAALAVLILPPAERAARGRAAAAWYQSRFAPSHAVARLRAAAAETPRGGRP